MPNDRQIADPWSAPDQAERYDEATNRLFYRSVVATLLREAPVLSGAGLDLGCGSGFSLEVMLDTYPNVAWTGVDASLPMLARAKEKPGIAELALVHAEAAHLPFPDRHFDVVVSSFAWHWFGTGAGEEVRRVLKPGGWLLAAIPLRQPSSMDGNRAVAQLIMAHRRAYVRRPSQGFRFDETAHLLPGPIHVARHEAVAIEEIFRDGAQMMERLRSRGAIQAILGTALPMPMEGNDPVAYEWPFAVLHAKRQ